VSVTEAALRSTKFGLVGATRSSARRSARRIGTSGCPTS